MKIGKGCLIGEGSIIRPGVKRGDKTIVAAASFVNKDVLENEIVGGVPQRHIKFLKK